MAHKAEGPLEQSCDIADIAQSSGRPFNLAKANEIKKSYPASAATCIEGYYYKLNLPVPEGYVPTVKPPPGYNPTGGVPTGSTPKVSSPKSSKGSPKAPSLNREVVQVSETVRAPIEKRQGCKEFALFWARGTLEPASTNNMGITMGTQVQAGLDKAMPGKWHTQGVQYPAALSDNFCVGLPGGFNCMEQLNKYHQSCPNTKIALAGYSQGAMTVRNCGAFITESARSKVIVSYTGLPSLNYLARK
jgi:cutinase